MLKPVTMPQIGLGGEEVIAREWQVAPGESFELGQVLLEIETDKASVDVEATFAGTLLDQRCSDGDTVGVGAVIAYAVEPGVDLEEAHAALATLEQPPPAATTAPIQARPQAPSVAATASTDEELVAFVRVEHGELAGIPLNGSPQRREPVAATPPADAALDSREAAGPGSDRALSRRRRAIARRMTASVTTPTFIVTREITTNAAAATVAAWREAGHQLTLTDVLLLACGVAGRMNPSTNAWVLTDEVVEFEHVNVSLAVDSPEGVMAPVVPSVEVLSLPALAKARSDLVTRAREGALDGSELLGATVTLSNVAGLGSHSITPVLTAPQAIALGVGSSRPTAEGGIVTVTFVGDHRLLDGADGARYLASFAEAMQASPTPE